MKNHQSKIPNPFVPNHQLQNSQLLGREADLLNLEDGMHTQENGQPTTSVFGFTGHMHQPSHIKLQRSKFEESNRKSL